MINIQELKNKQAQFFQTGATKNWEFRKNQLLKLKKAIYANYNNFIQVLQADLKKSEFEIIGSELLSVVEEIDLFLKKGQQWTKTKKVRRSFNTIDGQGEIQQHPYGVVLIISPWNYPVQLSLLPLVGAIAAGNCVMIKPSELTPKTSSLLATIIKNCFDPQYITIIEGDVAVTQQLLDQAYDKIFFTGSSQVGQIVLQKAAKYLTPVTLELGGKSPAIIDDISEIHMKKALKRILWGKFINSGQTCVASDYILIYKGVEEIFRRIITDAIKEFILEKPFYPIINEKHYNRIKNYLSEGKILIGGQTDDNNYSIELTILEPNDLNSSLMKDEIFGPLLPVLFYNTKEEARALINQICDTPLALYIFTINQEFEQYFLNNIVFGGASVNDTISHILVHDLPFGGIQTSGMGMYHGQYSFECFSRSVSVFKKGFFWDLPFRYPPYKKGINILKYLFNKYK